MLALWNPSQKIMHLLFIYSFYVRLKGYDNSKERQHAHKIKVSARHLDIN